jgi:hypothetical protein
VSEEVDGLALEAESDVGVDRRGHADVGVPQELLDDDGFDALFQEECHGRVAEVVEPDRPQVGLTEQRVEVTGEGGGLDGVPVGPREDVPVALPHRARSVSFAGLPLAVSAKRGNAVGWQGDASLGADGLGRQGGKSPAGGALEGPANAGGACVEVEVFPAQAEEFALAQSGAQREFEQRGVPVALGSGEELPGFVGGEGVEAAGTGVPVRTLRGISSSRTACSRADLRTEWMYASVSGESRLR